jgi:nicotinate-nucleotide pyrophosphorylase (carboxylating)
MSPKFQTSIDEFVNRSALAEFILLAKLEDMGPENRDVTSEAIVPDSKISVAHLCVREKGVLAGAALLPMIAELYSDVAGPIHVRDAWWDGQDLNPGDTIAEIAGPLRGLLAFERVALNFLTHLSGIATLTNHFVSKLATGSHASIYDTRKTIPGLRMLQKYAVRCGGGETHRIGLYDAMLIKDNHIAGVPLDQLLDAVQSAATLAREENPTLVVEVEVDGIDQLQQVIHGSIDIVLLDNMCVEDLERAVNIRDQHSPGVQLEASGGVTLDTVRAISQTGVDRISVGALTHSAPALDIGLDITP